MVITRLLAKIGSGQLMHGKTLNRNTDIITVTEKNEMIQSINNYIAVKYLKFGNF